MSTPKPQLKQLRNEAKRLLSSCQSGDPVAIDRLRRHASRLQRLDESELRSVAVLRDTQHVVACESGFATWDDLIGACETLLGVDRKDLSELLRNSLPGVSIGEIRVLDAGNLGGYSGCKKALVAVDSSKGEIRLLLKQLLPRFSDEADVYTALQRLGAPFATLHGTVDNSDSTRTMVLEYLPVTVEWPIPADYHLAWAESAARLAALRMPKLLPLPTMRWITRREEFEADLDDALHLDDSVLQGEFAVRGLAERVRAFLPVLPEVLEAAETLSTAFCHGDLYPQHTGRREGDGVVRFYDLGGSQCGPRFYDFASLAIDHGEPYEAEMDVLRDRFLAAYVDETGATLSHQEFVAEVQLSRALIVLNRLRTTMQWFDQLKQNGEDSGEFRTSPRKWFVLHLEALTPCGMILTSVMRIY